MARPPDTAGRRPTRSTAARRRAAIRRRRLGAALLLALLVVAVWGVMARGDDGDGGQRTAASDTADATATSTGGDAGTGDADGTTARTGASSSAPAQAGGVPRLKKKVLEGIPKELAVRRAAQTTKKVALTFDDGPSDYTDDVMRTLERYDARGTFFMLGNNIEGREEIVRTLVAHGHAIGDHSWSHPDLTKLSEEDRTGQVRDTLLELRRVTDDAVKIQLMRPPYGAMNAEVNAFCRTLGLVPIVWDVDSSDYQAGSTSKAIATRILDQVEDGSIILMHDGGGNRRATVEALPLILEVLRNRGYEAVTVPELLNTAPPQTGDANAFLTSMGGGAPAGETNN